jgi:uncharacterized protein (TIGR02001 family)
MKKSIVLATAVASVLASGVAAAELSGNAAIASNYIWRGVSQTENQAAGQGGIDWGHDSGLYVGTWVSNVDFSGAGGEKGYEMDIYAGFGGEAGSVGYDLGVITYQYPMEPSINFTEVYVSGTMSIVTIGLAYTVDAASYNDVPVPTGAFDSGDMYLNGSLDFAMGKSDVSIYAGTYMFDNDASGNEIDYSHYGASIGKDGFTFAVDKNDIGSAAENPWFGGDTADNVRFTASYAIDFEL